MQRKKKRSIIFELHSIPIKIRSLCTNTRKNIISLISPRTSNKRLYLVSYSIPLSLLVVLLLGLGIMINPGYSDTNKSYATEDLDSESNTETGISPQAADDPLDASITFSIGGAGQNEVVETAVDTVAYRSHTVQVTINNAEDYYLMISGQPNLSLSDGTKSLNGISGSNITGANIPAGQWGYSWDQTNTISDDSMVYKTVPSAQTRLNVPGLTNHATNFTGKLNFAAKFPDNATLGNYSSSVNLTLVVTPKANTGKAYWHDENGKETNYEVGTGTLQGIDEVDHGTDGGFCKGNDKIGIGWATELVDNRDGKIYPVYKAADGNCWMGRNLALNATDANGLLLTPADSDVLNDWVLPASVGSIPNGSNKDNINTSNTWVTNNANIIQIKTGDSSLSSYGWKEGYGNYYSWRSATAGTSPTSAIDSDATSSICPKGWRLPASYQDYSLNNVFSVKGKWQSKVAINGVSGFYGYYFGVNTDDILNRKVYQAANFWSAAGEFSGSLGRANDNDSIGFYWLSRASTGSKANLVYFGNGNTGTTVYHSSRDRWNGYSVRCVAQPAS